MRGFELAQPDTLEAAVGLLDRDDPTVRPIAGGTALLLLMKAGVFRPTKLVSLARVEPHRSAVTADGSRLQIGALVTLADLGRSEAVRQHAPLVGTILPRLANIRVRNVATIGGALAHADPHMDLPPVLMALGAEVSILGPRGCRTLLVEDLLRGYYETALGGDELIEEVRIPYQKASRGLYCKITTGSADDWPALGIAITLTLDGELVRSASIVVSAATEKATRMREVEAVLIGGSVDEGRIAEASDLAASRIETLTDLRGSAPYKRELLRIHLGRMLNALSGSHEAQK